MNILTPSGYKDINDVNVGDELIAYINGEVMYNTLESKERWYDNMTEDFTSNQGDFKFFILNNTFKLYKNQSIWANGNVSHAQYLQVGDTIYDDTDENIVITSIEEGTDTEWWRLKVSGDHSYIADGVTLHNASRFWVGGGSSTNWSATSNTNWSATSGGSNNATVPGASDDATLNGLGAAGNGASVVSANITVLSLTFAAGYTNTVTINTAVVLTIAGSFTDVTNHSWTVSGTGSMTISAASTITSGGKTFPGPVSFSGSNTKTLVGNWTISGTLTAATSTTTINKTASEVLSCAGLTVTGTVAGSISITLTGGTWGGSGSNNIAGTINFAGTSTFSATGSYIGGGTISYTSGTITTTASTLTLGASCTLNTNGMSWNNITLSNTTLTITINSLLTITGTFTLGSAAQTFAGTSGFTTANLTDPSVGTPATKTLKNGITYTITTAFTAASSRSASKLLFTSDDGTLTAALTLNYGATCAVLADFTRINASGGRTIWTFNGVLTTCTNIISFSDYPTSGIAS
jgi:hypothetical protein